LAVICASIFQFVANAQDRPQPGQKETIEPVFRVPRIKADKHRREEVGTKSTNDATKPTIRPEANRLNDDVMTGPKTVVSPPVARVADARPAELSTEKSPLAVLPLSNAEAAHSVVHPLDRALELARSGLENMRENIFDYTAILVKRERVGDNLGEANYIRVKVRNPRKIEGREVPFSIYMKFLKPRECAGREVIWVEGRNDNNLIAHETSPLLRFKNFHLDPTGLLAMKGNKYPIYEAGLEKLVLKLIEKAERDRAAGLCEVKYINGAQINKRSCRVIEVVHPQDCSPYEFHIAKVFIDDELEIPVRYVSYDWPQPGCNPQLIEEYTYINVELNVGLTDKDFDITNAEYNFAK
jgi:hypothetical protein